jgi:hypothetical protein
MEIDAELFKEFKGFAKGQPANESTGSEIGLNIRVGVRKSLNDKLNLMGDVKYTLGEANYLNIKVGVLFGI